MTSSRPVYDCDTAGYWCSDAAYANRDRRFGGFIENGEAYEITDKNTPRPWLNYLCNDRFGSVVSNTGLGFTWYKSLLLRITKYEHPIDYLPRQFEDGREIVLTDEETGGTWNHFRDAQDVRCVHRPGSTELTARHEGIEIALDLFVPADDPVECWVLRVRNGGTKPRRLTIECGQTWVFARFGIHTAEEGIPYLTTPGQDLAVTTRPGAVLAHSTHPEMPEMRGCFLSPDLAEASCELETVERKDSRVFRFPRCYLRGALRLAAGEEKILHVASGIEESRSAFDALVANYSSPTPFVAEREILSRQWRNLIDLPSCSLPDKDLQNFLNVWFKNQLFLTFRFIRSGFVGYRDTLQDSWGYTLMDPSAARRSLLRTLAHMKRDGTCPRNYSIIDDRHDLRAFMDSGTWIAMTLVDLIKETGEIALMQEMIPWLDSAETASVSDHAWAALDLLFQKKGAHGLCLVGDGDWNDALEGISRSGNAESAWLTMALVHAQNLMAELYAQSGERTRAEELTKRSEQLKDALQIHAWDGNWFVYGFTGSGQPIGSAKNREGRIHLNAQTWAVLSGVADAGQIERIRGAVKEQLVTPLGPALLAPPYVHDAAEVGRIAKLEPGTFENGAVYQHAVAFAIVADLVSGRPDNAVETFLRLLPTNPDNFDARRTSEPYATGNYFCGPGHPRFGQNFFSWFTGNPAWLLRAGFDLVLGVQADFEGLRVRPCVPSTWNEFRVKRRFRGATYSIHARREADPSRRGVWLDGRKIEGDLIPPQARDVAVTVGY